jgi:DNA (cytosine-5)-methyltransferase 1
MSIRVATVFSGIGAPEQALKQLGVEHSIVFACDNGERYLKASYEELLEIYEKQKNDNPTLTIRDFISAAYEKTGKPNYIKKSYFANYEISNEQWYEDVRFLDGTKYTGVVDLFVGGSPCQSFSTYGKKRGLEDARGTLFYDYARLVKEIQPKVFIYENVRGLLVHDNGKTWEVIKDVFESLNYEISYDVLDAQDYDLPQMRKRIFVVGIRKDIPHKKFAFPSKMILSKTARDYLDVNVPIEYYLGEKGFYWVTDRNRNDGKARVNRDIIGCQTAVQQNNWSGDFRIETPREEHYNDPNVFIGKYNGQDAVARKLTPSECLRLMGFENFKIVNDDGIMYRQSGNSIAVPVLKAIVNKILEAVSM